MKSDRPGKYLTAVHKPNTNNAYNH
jgi:hypothetical protein